MSTDLAQLCEAKFVPVYPFWVIIYFSLVAAIDVVRHTTHLVLFGHLFANGILTLNLPELEVV